MKQEMTEVKEISKTNAPSDELIDKASYKRGYITAHLHVLHMMKNLREITFGSDWINTNTELFQKLETKINNIIYSMESNKE